ncbi:MAG: ABC transporter ATP-binding protein [Bryobacterales bacterium]
MTADEQPIIDVKGLTKTYHMGGVDVHALRGVDLTARKGEFVAILGPSGSGKSTMFHIIGGLTPPSGGEVFIAGQNLSRMSDADRTALRRTTVGFVFQKFNLLPTLTAEENIQIARHIAGNKNSNDKEFEGLIRILGIEHRLHHKPYALSGGEQQRVAIARAIVNNPAILLADEPTGNLDTENSLAVLETLKHLNQETGQTILMITHNPEAASYCAHRIVKMRDGRIVEG